MIAVMVVVAALLAGCSVQAPEPVAVPEPRKIDCDLIFPGPLDSSR